MHTSDGDKALSDLDHEKMAAIKAVMGRIGHDFSNLLTPLLAYPAMVRMDLPPGARGRELLDVMERTAQDLAGITRLMLDFSLCDDFTPRPLNLNDVVGMAVAELKRRLPPDVVADVNLGAEPAAMMGGADQLGRVVEKLWQNAVDAMPDGGRLSVTTGRIALDNGRVVNGRTLPPGTFLTLSVTDTGRGIPEHNRTRAFEPFFTTKRDRAKRGAGLGLTYTYVAAAAHGGAVDMACPAQGGTTVTVYLPANHGP